MASIRLWLTAACTKITARQPKRCAPQATERPWLPSVAEVTVIVPVFSRHPPPRKQFHRPCRGCQTAPRQVVAQQVQHRIGAAQRLETAEAETPGLVLHP